MDKVYRLLPWLDMEQAADYLHCLTNTLINSQDLMQLCSSGLCDVFLDCTGATGESLWDDQLYVTVGSGVCRIKNPRPGAALGEQLVLRCVIGPAVQHPINKERHPLLVDFSGRGSKTHADLEWFVDSGIAEYRPLFKPADIEALAAKMDGEIEQPSASEVEDLRQLLEQERAARKAAEQRAEQAETGAKPSHMLAIAALLELLLDGSRPRYTQGAAADAIEARHPDWRGSSASQLTKLFAEAKATAREADKVAQAKAEARQAAASRAEARKTAKT